MANAVPELDLLDQCGGPKTTLDILHPGPEVQPACTMRSLRHRRGTSVRTSGVMSATERLWIKWSLQNLQVFLSPMIQEVDARKIAATFGSWGMCRLLHGLEGSVRRSHSQRVLRVMPVHCKLWMPSLLREIGRQTFCQLTRHCPSLASLLPAHRNPRMIQFAFLRMD